MNLNRRSFVLALCSGLAAPAVPASERVFVPEQSQAALERFLLERRVVLAKMRAPQLVDAMLAFYRTGQALGLAEEPQSDMLLFQWGASAVGQDRSFKFDVTRQFIRPGGDDEGMSQLSLTASYAPADLPKALKPGNMWCESQDDVPKFERAIKQTPAYRAVAFLRPTTVEVVWSPV